MILFRREEIVSRDKSVFGEPEDWKKKNSPPKVKILVKNQECQGLAQPKPNWLKRSKEYHSKQNRSVWHKKDNAPMKNHASEMACSDNRHDSKPQLWRQDKDRGKLPKKDRFHRKQKGKITIFYTWTYRGILTSW